MADSAGETSRLLRLFRLGDNQASGALIEHAYERLGILAKRMLKEYPALRRWERTDDVLQNALLRLWQALKATKPESVLHFRRLAALQIRRELIDLARHYMGPEGHGAKHHTDKVGKVDDGDKSLQKKALNEEKSLRVWTEFHELAEALPEQELEAFDLLYYDGLSQEDAAALMGISVRTMKRRWQSARLKIAEAMEGRPPT